MNQMLDLPLLVFLLSGLVTMVSMSLALIRLRSRHSSKWDELGRPTILRALLRPGDRADALREFIQGGGHRRVGDPVLSFLLSTSLAATWTAVVSLLLVFVLDLSDMRNTKDFLSGSR